MNYAPIHNHSEYSALDGLATMDEIADRCEEIGVTAVGVTDHGTVSGHLEFAEVMAERGIRPVFGCELYHGVKTKFGKNERDQAHFIAGALTDQGLRNLWRLVDQASTNFRYVGRVNWDMLKGNSEGLFATSACIQGLVSQQVIEGETEALNHYLEIFGERFYIELHTYPGDTQAAINAELVRIATERGIPLIYATDAHFASPCQYEIHDTFVAMQTGDTILMPHDKRKMWHPKALFIQDAEEIRKNLSYLPEAAVDEALTNSGELAAKCNAGLPSVNRHLPAFLPRESPWIEDKEANAASVFLQEVEKGLKRRYGNGVASSSETVPEEVWNRAVTEMEVFLDAGLEHYFLQAWDFCQFCDAEGIKRGPGRGSAAGSIVAYALGITDIEPLKYGLIFERFYNPGREKGFPDIDNDIPRKDRERVKKYLEDRWGRDKVRSIGTITRLKPKAAIDKTYKACGMTFLEAQQLKAIVQNTPDIEILGPDSIGWDEEVDPGKTVYVMEHVGESVEKWVKNTAENEKHEKRIRHWLSIVRTVCSRISGYGIHPSGVVVSDVPLEDELPCMTRGEKKIQVTCFPMDDVDGRMFVKQDLLGLRNLDTLQEWEDQVSPTVGEIDWSNLDESDTEEGTWELLDHGLSLGIFQIEDGYARHLCKEFKPRSIEDLGIIVALNRPGPIRSGAPDSFITRRNGGTDEEFDGRKVAILADITEPTYGWFLYQEQVIAFFTKLGYSLSDADAVRKILGKKKPEQMKALYAGEDEWEGRGYLDMATAANLQPVLAQTIWDKLEDFAKYSFNKSHAIAYATIAFRTLFAKYYAPAQFFIACIRTNPDEAGKYVSEARRMEIRVLPPDIDQSQSVVDTVNGQIYFGFSNIKGIGKGSADFICKLRDQYEITSPEKLVEAIADQQTSWQEERDAAKAEGKPFKKRSPKQILSQNRIPPLFDAGAWDRYEDRPLTLPERQALEKELLGVIISDNCDEILARNHDEVKNCDSYPLLDLAEDGQQVHLPGIVSNINPKKTRKSGESMGLITIEFQGDQVEFVVFPREWRQYKFLWKERTPGIFALSRSDRGPRFESALILK